MAKGSGWKRGPSKGANMLKRYEKNLQREMKTALVVAVDAGTESAKRRAYPTKRVSDSDSVSGRKRTFSGRTPVRKKIFKSQNRGTISAIPYYTYSRTAAIKRLFTAFGKRDALTRKGLRVYRPWVKLSQLVTVNFANDRGLKNWAIKRKMIEKHKVQIDDPRIISALLLKPMMKREAETFKRIYESAFIAAGARL